MTSDSSEAAKFTGAEKARVLVIYLALAAATILGVGASILVGRASVVLAGLVIVAFVFGLRHGMDADHISAIDNVTRKLIQEGKRPLTVGTWFSLGHSTVVLVMVIALVAATKTIVESVPFLQSAGAALGTAISGTFLWLIGLMNLAIVFGLYSVFRGLRGRDPSGSQEYEQMLDSRGFMSRYFRSLFRLISQPWKAYWIGLLFGLGFDTASEIALIAISVGVGVSGSVPIWMVLLLPFMFTCGMVLVDTTDGVAMRLAYGWAVLNPMRKVYYNLTITIISVLVAFAIGTVELLQVVSVELKLQGPLWGYLGSLDFESLGFVVVGVFGATWLLSMANWKYRDYDRLGQV